MCATSTMSLDLWAGKRPASLLVFQGFSFLKLPWFGLGVVFHDPCSKSLIRLNCVCWAWYNSSLGGATSISSSRFFDLKLTDTLFWDWILKRKNRTFSCGWVDFRLAFVIIVMYENLIQQYESY